MSQVLKIENIVSWYSGREACREKLTNILRAYIKMRIYHAIKNMNQELQVKPEKVPKQNGNLAKFSHILLIYVSSCSCQS